MSQDKQLDLNSAGREQLSALPGISNRRADAIVAGRPYANPKDLVGKRILSKAEYERIADRVTVKK